MNIIEQKIKAKGLTKAHVAKMVGIDQSTLSRVISGKQSNVSSELINKIFKYLDAVNSDDKKIFNK